LRDTELLAWCGEVIRSVLADPNNTDLLTLNNMDPE
jgi:hypothetical protein